MNPAERLEKLEQLLDADPADSFTRYALALEHISRRDTDRGIALLRETIDRDPSYIAAYHMLGQQLAQLGDEEEAGNVLRNGIEVARAAGETHAASEMQDELDDLG
ncbi:hypothetical protein KQI65_15265 [bacterium]|nr:hypothetical protein [bacterium]